MAKITNSLIHETLVDNKSTVNILYWHTKKKTGLTRADLSPTTSPIYGFTKDYVVPKGTIKMAITLGEYPRMMEIMTEFLIINCPSAFNGVLSRPLLQATKAVTSICFLTMKFPTTVGINQV